ncbi:MAG: hypothetical protein IJA15_08150 [Clostridia bacterium]|nr:hypothetical protein [Clostridia bacterium]
MEAFKLIGLALTTGILCYYLKSISSELFIPCLIISGLTILIFAFDYISYTFNFFSTLGQKISFDNEIFKLLFKIIIIAYLIEFAGGLIEDVGLKSIADKLIFSGKILLLCMSIPIFEFLIETIYGFLN